LCGVGTGIATGKQAGVDILGSIENVIGSQANDKIEGNSLANVLDGGVGNDHMKGGGGSDTFVFEPGFGNDRITDFDAKPAGGQDFLDISAFGITSADFAERVTIADVGADTLVTIDGDPGQTIHLTGISNVMTVTQADFLL
jgi:Ca2+-binding RTX toxin-like protein